MLTPAQNHPLNANSDILTMLHMCTTEDEMASYVTQQYRWLIETLDQRYDALKAAKSGKKPGRKPKVKVETPKP